MRKARSLVAVYVLDVRDVWSHSWIQDRLIHFASQLGLGLFDVYTDVDACGDSDFRMLNQLVHDAARGCFDTVIVRWSPCLEDNIFWSHAKHDLLDMDVDLYVIHD